MKFGESNFNNIEKIKPQEEYVFDINNYNKNDEEFQNYIEKLKNENPSLYYDTMSLISDKEFSEHYNNKSEELLEEEKTEIAKMYHILNIDDLIKKDGKWYFHGQTVEDYDSMMSGNDNSEMYKRDFSDEAIIEEKPILNKDIILARVNKHKSKYRPRKEIKHPFDPYK
jgi:hypothetical protein